MRRQIPRAPDILYKILEKGKGRLVKISDIADVRFGIKTGANEFFYLDQRKINEYGIEDEFLKPVIKSTRECKGILIDPKDLKFKILMCHENKSDLQGTNVLKYIKWGEGQGFHRRPTCAPRDRWWDLGKRSISDVLYPYIIGEIHKIPLNLQVLADNNMFDIISKNRNEDSVYKLGLYLNSTLFRLFLEMTGREMTGALTVLKVQVYELQSIPFVSSNLEPDKIKDIIFQISSRNIESLVIELGFDPNKPIREQSLNPLSDRKDLDNAIFDALGLSELEKKEVCFSVAELIKNRLDKSKSIQ